MNEDDRRELFTHHAPTVDQVHQYKDIRNAGLILADTIAKFCPSCADTSNALRCVREAVMWANAAIACSPPGWGESDGHGPKVADQGPCRQFLIDPASTNCRTCGYGMERHHPPTGFTMPAERGEIPLREVRAQGLQPRIRRDVRPVETVSTVVRQEDGVDLGDGMTMPDARPGSVD